MQPILTWYTFVLCKVVKNFHRVSLVRTALQRSRSYFKTTWSCEKPQMLKKNQAWGITHLVRLLKNKSNELLTVL